MKDIENVRVAIRIRPQSANEHGENVPLCQTVSPGKPQLTISRNKTFTYDYVFDQQTSQEAVYDQCVHKLVEGSFDGYNATVFAYGQTGSGKTYTMGTTSFETAGQQTNAAGIIPRAVQQFFNDINERRKTARKAGKSIPSFEISVQFIELYNEELIDLLSSKRHSSARITIHEHPARHEIMLHGVSSRNVTSPEGILSALKEGARGRTTAATNKNQQSSRSHAIFTLNINQSRLALGNVISALGRANGQVGHVPYRDSKLTRLLQDSLGGNSRTLMIACVSPNEPDQEETLRSLKYANRAKNIKNEVVANQHSFSKLITELKLRNQILEDRNQILEDRNQILEDRNQIVEAELLEWQTGKKRRRSETKMMEQLAKTKQKILETEAERDNILNQMAAPKKPQNAFNMSHESVAVDKTGQKSCNLNENVEEDELLVAMNPTGYDSIRFTRRQTLELEKEYSEHRYVYGLERMELAQRLKLSEKQVEHWFKNRRHRSGKTLKKKK
uniref:Kinesin-like protein n=1 Tax=Globodera rostochiensis TaxID=31243 RepID=A0A914GV80_GLORO